MAGDDAVLRRPGLKRPSQKDAIRIKVISMGDQGVGKSCLIKRYCEERFVTKYISTIGVDFGVKKWESNGLDVKVNFWDLAGHADFFEVRNEFYKDAQGAILVFDVSSKRSFESLDSWVQEAKKYGALDSLRIVVCGNKNDLKKRSVSEKEGREWAAARGYKYYDTSACDGGGVAELFEDLFRSVVDIQAPLKQI